MLCAACGEPRGADEMSPTPCYQCGLLVGWCCAVETNSGVRHWRCPDRRLWRKVKREVPYGG